MSLLKKKEQLVAVGNVGANEIVDDNQGQVLNTNADSPEVQSRAYSGRAELRHHNQVLKLLCVLQLVIFVIIFCYGQVSWTKHSNYLAERQYVVYEVAPDGSTSVKPSTLYQPREPLDQQIRHEGGMFIYWLVSAGSDDIDRCLGEARRLIHQELVAKFDEISEKVKPGIKQLNIYRRVENLQVKTLSDNELPANTQNTRYHVLVTGKVLTYRIGNNELADTREFAYHVELVPLDTPSDWNPAALLVKDFQEVKQPAKKNTDTSISANANANAK